MITLYIDTSSSFLYAGIVNENTIEAEVKEEFGHKLSEAALPEIVSMFEKNNLQAKDVDKITKLVELFNEYLMILFDNRVIKIKS